MNGRWPRLGTSRRKILRGVAPVAGQRSSHRNQLVQFSRSEVRPDSVDAIVVPTSRQAGLLSSAVDLARQHKCALLVLCSKQASVDDVKALAMRSRVNLVAVDIDRIRDTTLPSFRTDEMLTGTPFGRDTDLSFKRNLALLFSLLAGWQRIVFLDDDIVVPDPGDLGRATALLRNFPAVGLGLGGFPDNSVVCHANRAVGGEQETFIGGGAMAVSVSRMSSFYPNIYNEDWFFLIGERRSRRYGVVGRALQAPYDPYGNADRARSEEFGDCLAEGLYALLDVGQYGQQSVSRDYWVDFLAARRRLIGDIAESVDGLRAAPAARKRMAAALDAAFQRCHEIRPEFCVDYLTAWRADRALWSEFVLRTWRDQPRLSGENRVRAAIRTLGLGAATRHVAAPRSVERLDQHRTDVLRVVAVAR
jgi:hypothetical protein